MQGSITKRLLIVLVPGVMLLIGTSGAIDKPLALGPEVGLHGGVPLLPVGASEDWDHLVKSAGHGSNSCWEVDGVSK